MRNPDGGAAERRPHFMYKVPSPAQFFFFFWERGWKRRGIWPWTWQFGGCGCIATDSSRIPKKQRKKSKAIWLIKYSLSARKTLKAKHVSIQPDLEMQLEKGGSRTQTNSCCFFFLQTVTLLTFYLQNITHEYSTSFINIKKGLPLKRMSSCL